MNKGYLFISNSTKPTKEQANNRENIKLSNVSIPCIEAAASLGYRIHMGINRNHPENLKAVGYNVNFYDSHTYRSITAIKDNWIAFKNACNYLRAHPEIRVIHCNTPIGGAIGRLVGKKFGCKVIYTAHGFHFFKGAPIFNKTILRLAEKILAHYTDVIITINQEDFEAAQRFNLKSGGKVYKVPGVGVNLDSNQTSIDKSNLRKEIGLKEDDFVCICMGDIVKRKNYKTAIESIAKTNNKIHYLICGIGPETSNLQDLARKLKIEERVHFLGFRKDIKELLSISNVFLFSSLQEGLPRSTMEAMAAGLPCVVSNIRGNNDLIDDNKGGYLVSSTDSEAFAIAISKLYSDSGLREKMGKWNLNRIHDFSIDKVRKAIKEIYNSELK